DYQMIGVLPGTPFGYTANIGAARIKGIEWDFVWRAPDHWTVSLNGDYLNDKFTEINALSTNYDVGDPVDLVPKYQYTVSVQRDFSLNAKQGFYRFDFSQQGPETYRIRTIGPWYFYESDVTHLLNGRLGLQWTDNLRMGLFARNLLNDQGFINPYGNI